LLLDEDHWARVAGLLHASWYVQVDDALRLQRLQARHERYGKTTEFARQWVAQTDEPNARKIEATRARATQVVVVG
jgi:pantothenate kinase